MAGLNFTKQRQAAFLEQIRNGMQRGAAAREVYANDDPQIRRRVREYILSHPNFEKAVLDAEVEALENVQEAAYQAAISGAVAAMKFWIEWKTGGQKTRQAPAAPPAPETDTPTEDADGDELFKVVPIDPRLRRQ